MRGVHSLYSLNSRENPPSLGSPISSFKTLTNPMIGYFLFTYISHFKAPLPQTALFLFAQITIQVLAGSYQFHIIMSRVLGSQGKEVTCIFRGFALCREGGFNKGSGGNALRLLT